MNVKTPISEVFNGDCMDYMAGLPDVFFDLVIADPPYGIFGTGGGKSATFGWLKKKESQGGTWSKKYGDKAGKWDNAPGDEFFIELRRVSQEQIIWGANHFGYPFDNYVVWDKWIAEAFTMGMVEMASVSCGGNPKMFSCRTQGNQNNKRFHPTQKPVALYKWLLTNYAKPGQKIFDPMMGSQSSRIAAWDMGFDYYGCELDKDYFREGCDRFEKHKAKPVLFAPEQMYQFEQPKLFEE